MKKLLSKFNIFIRYNVVGAIIASLIFILSFYLYNRVRDETHERDKRRFEYRVELAETAIKNRILDYVQVLKGFKGLLLASDSTTRLEWHKYYESLSIDKVYPGIQGIAFAKYIHDNEKSELVEKVSKEGFYPFKIFPEGKRQIYTPIVYIEPFGDRNLRAFGYDMFSDSIRRKAMETARDENKPVFSGIVKLIQETSEDIQPGFLLFIPIYKTYAVPKTVEERRNNIEGFAYCPFRAYDLMNSILKKYNELGVEIFDGNEMSKSTVLYNSDSALDYTGHTKSEFTTLSSIQIGNRTWNIFFSSKLSTTNASPNQPYIILVGGSIISLLILIVVYSFSKKRKADYLKLIITDNATAALFIIDTDGYCIFMNPAGEKITGYSFREIRDKPFLYMVHKSNHNFIPISSIDAQQALLQMKEVHDYEDVFIRKDGSKYNVLCSWRPIFDYGKPTSVVIEVKDITEEKKAKAEILNTANQLKIINTDLDNFIYTASHDLKAPIANLEGLVIALNKSTSNRLSNTELTLFSMMTASIDRLKKTIGDLTEITKAQKGIDKDLEEINLKELLEDVKADLVQIIEKAQPSIKESLDIEKIKYVKKDLRSIIYNLISNAIKFKASYRPLIIEVKTYMQENFLVIFVKDNGLGIKEEYQSKLFTMFKRLHSHVEGTGIGLYILKRMIENKGGRIEVESKEGQGSTFKVFLKLTED